MYMQIDTLSSNLPKLVAAAVEPTNGLQPQQPDDHWSGLTLNEVAARLDRAAGLRVFPDRAHLAAKLAAGDVTDDDLVEAIAHSQTSGVTVAELREALDQAPRPPGKIPTVAELAADVTGIEWPEILSERIGCWADAHFHRNHTLWGESGNFDTWGSWRDWATHDLTPEIRGLKGFAEFAGQTDRDPWRALGAACRALGIDAQAAPSVFERLLCDMWAWTRPVQNRDGTNRGGVGPSETAAQFLAIRLVWEQALLRRFEPGIGAAWRTALMSHRTPTVPTRDHLIDAILQDALAIASARTLDGHLRVMAPVRSEVVEAQLVFTADARSERFRRALEDQAPNVRTYGVGESFGLPPETAIHDGVPLSKGQTLIPAVPSDHLPPGGWLARVMARVWHAPVSSFALVHLNGLMQVGALVRRSMGETYSVIGYGKTPRIDVDPTSPEAADIAERALRKMGLTSKFAPMVVLMARQSRTWRAPDGTNCQSTRHARALVQLLNETPIRQSLARRGVEIDPKCVFIAAAHDTVSDCITLYTCDGVGSRYPRSVKRLRRALEKTSSVVREERALKLHGIDSADQLLYRGGNWAEPAPDVDGEVCKWFVIGSRRLTAGANLDGAAALHDYDESADPNGDILTGILARDVLSMTRAVRKCYLAAVAPSLFGDDGWDVGVGYPEVSADGASPSTPISRPMCPGCLVVRVAASREHLERALAQVPDLVSMQAAGWVAISTHANLEPRSELSHGA